MKIVDVSPRLEQTTITLPRLLQSVSGKSLCISTSPSGMRVYLGGHSGVWRSDDGGETWWHPEKSQPPAGQYTVPGALLAPNVYDLVVSPTDDDVVLAATGRDARRPAQHGVYRSESGGVSWQLVHQFVSGNTASSVGTLAIAPDDPQLVCAGGTTAVGLSTDGGNTWTETAPANAPGSWARHVVVGPLQDSMRRMYVVGAAGVWYSQDGGQSWRRDPVNLTLAFPTDAAGTSSRALSLHPLAPHIIYINMNGALWRGDFSNFDAANSATWQQLPSVPIGYPSTTASGGDYIVAHASPSGQLYLFASDRRTVHVSVGEPQAQSDWDRIDGEPVHVDPHGLALTPNFRLPSDSGSGFGRIYMVNDGGANYSTDGAQVWRQGKKLSTLGLVNAAVLPRAGGNPAICIGMGDNSGYFSPDGGLTWKTQDYLGGDNDACFSDPRQPNRLIVFAPRTGLQGLFLYTAPPGDVPDGAIGTSQKTEIPGPPPASGSSNSPGWNAGSYSYNFGYRPLILTLSDESPRPDGDFITLLRSGTRAFLVRTTALSQIADADDWIPTASSEAPGVKAFRQGPDLPDVEINVVQASGGHQEPVYYIGDPDGNRRLWKWTQGMSAWQQIVPGPDVAGSPVPGVAARFFVDPYRPDLVYVLDRDHIRRSNDGGASWVVDDKLERALTEEGAFPLDIPYDGTPGQALVRDMLFDPNRARYRFAVGPAGVFYTTDGTNWQHLILSSAIPMRPVNAAYDFVSDSCGRALYVCTSNRGVLRLAPLPPEWDFPIGAVVAAEGKISLLRVHDVGTKFGPPSDQIDAEVIVFLDTEPGKAFGFQLRSGDDEGVRRGMLDQLRRAFNADRRIRIEYTRVGCRTGEIFRVIETI